jgi:EPS-associated MarR family transcriptional regulator
MLDDNARYKLLRLLEQNPESSQRELADEIGFSLGKTNYCIQALIDKGWVKVQSFRNSRNKSAYMYQLTPAGVGEKIRVTRRFLALKIREYAAVTAEIEQLKQEVRRNDERNKNRLSE